VRRGEQDGETLALGSSTAVDCDALITRCLKRLPVLGFSQLGCKTHAALELRQLASTLVRSADLGRRMCVALRREIATTCFASRINCLSHVSACAGAAPSAHDDTLALTTTHSSRDDRVESTCYGRWHVRCTLQARQTGVASKQLAQSVR